MKEDKPKKPPPIVEKKKVQEFIKRQPEETQRALKKALKEQGILGGD